MDGFRRGREEARAARAGRARPPNRHADAAPSPPLARGKATPIKIGYHCPLESDELGAPLFSNTERAILLFGLNGAGKSTRFLIELLATTCNRSLVVFDIKGELAYQTAAHETALIPM